MSISRLDFLKQVGILGLASFLSPRINLDAKNLTIKKQGKMKLSFRPFEAQLRHVFTVSGHSRTTTPIVLTEIEYNGIIGYGEASMPPYLGESQASVMDFLKKVNLEQFSNPFEMEDILTYVDSIAPKNTAAKACLDIALHDLVGKLMGKNWLDIWGYTRSKAPTTSFTIGMDTDEMVRKKTLEAAPYGILKVKLGSHSDKQIVKTIRSVTDKPLCVDVNQGWKDKHFALDMIHFCKENGFVFVEQPMPKEQIDDMAWLTAHSPLPTIADESCQRLSDISNLKGVFNGINIKLMKCTGMREANKMINVARALDMKVMVGCMTETSCAISAASQFSPACDFADLDGNLLITNDCFEGTKIINGFLSPSTNPGIGVIKTI